jgi:hypothetical protein
VLVLGSGSSKNLVILVRDWAIYPVSENFNACIWLFFSCLDPAFGSGSSALKKNFPSKSETGSAKILVILIRNWVRILSIEKFFFFAVKARPDVMHFSMLGLL